MKNLSRFQALTVYTLMNIAFIASSAWADNLPIPAESVSNGVPVIAGGSAPQANWMSFAPFALMFAVLYFLVLRPQQKKMKEQQDLLASLKQGDEIITHSGILGKVTGITDKVVTVEVADQVRMKMLKSQVSQVLKGSVKDLSL